MGKDRGSATINSADLRPVLSFSVGVTGHRNSRLEAASTSRAELAAVLERLFASIEGSLLAVWREHSAVLSPDKPRLRLVSPLAQGADQIAANAALERSWLLDACLPFREPDYADDFADDGDRAAFSHMLGRAHAVYELSGGRDDEPAAYEAVGRITLDQSDLLVGIWDGDLPGGRGGTAQIVAEAVAQRIPVIHINPRALDRPQLLWSGLENLDFELMSVESVPRAPVEEILDPVVRALTAPPADPHNLQMLGCYLADEQPRFNVGFSYPLLLNAAGLRKLRRSDFVPPRPEACAVEIEATLMPLLETRCSNTDTVRTLSTRYGHADAAALCHSRLYRSGFVTNFALAAAAVLLALSGLLFPGAKLTFITLELLAVLLILVNTRAGTRGQWHERWMDNRHLAERLRCLGLMRLVGDLDLRDREERDAAAVPDWVRWYSRATARELGLLRVTADHKFLRDVRDSAIDLLRRQIDYQTASAHTSHLMEHRLERAGEWLFGGTLLACLTWIVLKLLGIPMEISGPVTVTEVVTFLTALLPAVGAALYGIRMQGDFAGLAQRARSTAGQLTRLVSAMEREPLHQEKLAGGLRRLADIALADVDRWRSAFKSRPLSLPG